MEQPKSSGGKQPLGPAAKDIGPILRGWEYEPGAINVRRIIGNDGAPKLQMRLDLGLLQMEVEGRPDGVRPYGCESLLEHFEQRLRRYRKQHGTDEGFMLDPAQCQSLREEALMYYHRYLSLFVLGDYAGVARDTARNLRVLDLCGSHAAEESDRLVLEQYRPYIIMMHTRALASIELERENFRAALRLVKRGLHSIRDFFSRFGQEESYSKANEVRLLKRFRREIRSKLPVHPLRQLQRKLKKAVKAEKYEDAARLRDEIARMMSEKPATAGD